MTSGYTAGSTCDVLLRADPLQQPPHGARREQPERVVMGAGADGGQHLVRFGGREHEDEVLGWLLDGLEQRIEALRRDHVRLVDDEHPVARLGRRIGRAVAQVAGVVDAAVAGGVEFDHVEVARPTRRQRHTRHTLAARSRRRTLDAVQRAGQDARRRRLAASARPGEEIGVVDPARVERGRQRFGDVLLPHHLGERRRSIFPVQSHGPRVPADTDRPGVGGRRGPGRPAHPTGPRRVLA